MKRLFLIAVAVFCAVSDIEAQTSDLRSVSRTMQTVVAKVSPTVVQIRTTAYGPVQNDGAATIGTQRSTGSGVILSADGYIVTNAHVVEGGRRFIVVLPRPAAAAQPGRSALAPVSQEVPASLVGVDQETDLAVLKVELTGLPVARLGDSDLLAPGEVVLAFGSPFGLASSVTMGVVSAVGRQLDEDDRMLYIQTDTPINPGNSGGPLVSVDGEVVGINTLIYSNSGGSEGIGFAAPSTIVRFVYEQLRAEQRVRRGEIGVFAQTITPAIATSLKLSRDWGVVLGDVYPNSPADRVGLLVGDVILSMDGKPMENGRQFDVNLYRKKIGTAVTLEVGRGLKRITVRVPVVERQGEGVERFLDSVTPEENLVPELGMLGIPLTEELAVMLPGVRYPQGVAVAAVTADGGLATGDVVYAVNGSTVRTIGELRAAVNPLEYGSSVVLQVGRRGQLRYVTLVIE